MIVTHINIYLKRHKKGRCRTSVRVMVGLALLFKCSSLLSSSEVGGEKTSRNSTFASVTFATSMVLGREQVNSAVGEKSRVQLRACLKSLNDKKDK